MSIEELDEFIRNENYDIHGKELSENSREERIRNERARLRRKLCSLYGYSRINWQAIDEREKSRKWTRKS